MEATTLHFDTWKQIDTLRHHEAIQRAAAWNLWRQVQPDRSNWFAQQRRRILCQIGHTLVQLGRWLERSAIMPTA